MASTPLQGDPVPNNSDSPLTGTHMLSYGTAAEKRSIMRFASASARDTAIPSGSRVEGMCAYLQDVDLLTVWNGSTWVEYGGKRQRAWTNLRSVTDSVTSSIGTFYNWGDPGPGNLVISNAPIGDWLVTWSLVGKYSVTLSGNVRCTWIPPGGSELTLNGDMPNDQTGGLRWTVNYTATVQTTTVGTLTFKAYGMASSGGVFDFMTGSRVTAAYLGPR